MASTTSDSLPSYPSLPATAALDAAAADQEISSHHHHHHSLFLPSSSSAASLYLDSSFHGLLPASSSTAMSPSYQAPPLPPPPAPSKRPKKRPRASRCPPTTVLTTDTSNFRAMVQEFTGFPASPFATDPPPTVRPQLLGGDSAVGPPFLLRPSPIKYPHNPVLLPPTCTTTTLANTITTTTSSNNITSTSSLVDALALFARSNVMPSTAAAAAAGGSSADHYGHGMGGFNPFDDFEAAAAEGEKANTAGYGFFSSLDGAGDKYDRH